MSLHEPKKRLKAAESRQALLDAGVELLKARGLAPGLDRVTLKDAIELSGVPRSTAYRLYEGGEGQLEEYRADLLRSLDSSIDTEPTNAAIAAALEECADLIESRDPAKLAAALREVVRVGVQANVDSVAESVDWRVYMSSLASVGTGLGVNPETTELYRNASFGFGERFVEMMTHVASVFGIRPRAPMTVESVGALISSIIEGVVLRQSIDPRLANEKRPTGRDGAMQSWSAAAMALEAILLTAYEPDPNSAVCADLGTWSSFS